MKNFLFILSIILFINCNDQPSYGNQFLNKTPKTTVVNTDNIQYDIEWNFNNTDVDIRIITLQKNGRKHDYVVSTSHVGRAGGISIDHWEGCDCKY